ncbi:MAG: hypothetical protein WCO23_02365 [bacterium]
MKYIYFVSFNRSVSGFDSDQITTDEPIKKFEQLEAIARQIEARKPGAGRVSIINWILLQQEYSLQQE